jgi:hypothetical protein
MKFASRHRYHDLEIFLNEGKRPLSAKRNEKNYKEGLSTNHKI